MIGWNWTGQQKGERKVIMPTNAVGQETVSANFCLALPCSLILFQSFGKRQQREQQRRQQQRQRRQPPGGK